MDIDQVLFILRNLLILHGNECSMLDRDIKTSLCDLIINFTRNLVCNMSYEEIQNQKYIISNQYVYCWTKDHISNLKNISKKNKVYLCTSLDEHAFNHDIGNLFSSPYKYLYKFHIKEYGLGVNVNNFFSDLDEEDRKNLWFPQDVHQNEKEIIVSLNDIDEIYKYDKKSNQYIVIE